MVLHKEETAEKFNFCGGHQRNTDGTAHEGVSSYLVDHFDTGFLFGHIRQQKEVFEFGGKECG